MSRLLNPAIAVFAALVVAFVGMITLVAVAFAAMK